MASPTKSERNAGIISLVGAAIVATSVFMPYINAGLGIFSDNRTPFHFGMNSHFSPQGFGILIGAALIALSGLRFLKVIYPKKGPNGIGLFISCVIAGFIVHNDWSTTDWTGPVRRAYGGAIGYVGVAIGIMALIVYVSTRHSDESVGEIKLPTSAAVASPMKVAHCHQCGTVLNTTADLCASCGTTLKN